jgi:calcineurin-like phosphoesterase family protein
MRWFTSDEHYGHLRIPELAARPFGATHYGVGEMNADLIRRHNAVVGDEDEVWHLGDFAMGTIADTLPLVRELAGRRHVLVAGNHDRCWPGYRLPRSATHDEWARKYKAAGFHTVWNAPSTYPSPDLGGRLVNVSHFPYQGGGDSHDEERYREWRLEDDGLWLLCGHVHQNWRQRGRMINVGVDAWGGYPVSQATIEAMIAGEVTDRSVKPWKME